MPCPEPEGLQVVHAGPMRLLPPAPGKCQTCAVEHDPAQPHDQESLYYQTAFHQQHGRHPTWADALSHCDEETKRLWAEELREFGVQV